MESSKSYHDLNPLPQEIIIEILTRLPVKSLLKFRCVCKSWLFLISSPKFIKTHLNKSTKSNNYANHNLILGSCSAPISYSTCSLSSVLYDTSSINAIDLDLPLRHPIYLPWIIGSCNGLLCVSIDPDTLVLYNPSIRKFKKLPFSGTDAQSSSYITYGFGYNALNDDYKVVELCVFTNDGVRYDTEVKIYSLRKNSWRKMMNCPYGYVSNGSAASVCGKLHLLAARSDDGFRVIVSLDMVTEEFDEMGMFKGGDGEVDWSLMDFGGSLYACGECYKLRVDVWVMKEYGVVESWMKLVSVPYPVDHPWGQLWPVFVSENGEVLLNCQPHVMLYKSSYGTFETREIQGHGGSVLVSAPPYIESLVLPCFGALS